MILTRVLGNLVTYRGHLAILEGADNTVDLKLAVNISLLLLRIQWLVDGGHDCCLWWNCCPGMKSVEYCAVASIQL